MARTLPFPCPIVLQLFPDGYDVFHFIYESSDSSDSDCSSIFYFSDEEHSSGYDSTGEQNDNVSQPPTEGSLNAEDVPHPDVDDADSKIHITEKEVSMEGSPSSKERLSEKENNFPTHNERSPSPEKKKCLSSKKRSDKKEQDDTSDEDSECKSPYSGKKKKWHICERTKIPLYCSPGDSSIDDYLSSDEDFNEADSRARTTENKSKEELSSPEKEKNPLLQPEHSLSSKNVSQPSIEGSSNGKYLRDDDMGDVDSNIHIRENEFSKEGSPRSNERLPLSENENNLPLNNECSPSPEKKNCLKSNKRPDKKEQENTSKNDSEYKSRYCPEGDSAIEDLSSHDEDDNADSKKKSFPSSSKSMSSKSNPLKSTKKRRKRGMMYKSSRNKKLKPLTLKRRRSSSENEYVAKKQQKKITDTKENAASDHEIFTHGTSVRGAYYDGPSTSKMMVMSNRDPMSDIEDSTAKTNDGISDGDSENTLRKSSETSSPQNILDEKGNALNPDEIHENDSDKIPLQENAEISSYFYRDKGETTSGMSDADETDDEDDPNFPKCFRVNRYNKASSVVDDDDDPVIEVVEWSDEESATNSTAKVYEDDGNTSSQWRSLKEHHEENPDYERKTDDVGKVSKKRPSLTKKGKRQSVRKRTPMKAIPEEESLDMHSDRSPKKYLDRKESQNTSSKTSESKAECLEKEEGIISPSEEKNKLNKCKKSILARKLFKTYFSDAYSQKEECQQSGIDVSTLAPEDYYIDCVDDTSNLGADISIRNGEEIIPVKRKESPEKNKSPKKFRTVDSDLDSEVFHSVSTTPSSSSESSSLEMQSPEKKSSISESIENESPSTDPVENKPVIGDSIGSKNLLGNSVEIKNPVGEFIKNTLPDSNFVECEPPACDSVENNPSADDCVERKPVAKNSTRKTPASVSDESKPLAGASHESKPPAVASEESKPPDLDSVEDNPSADDCVERKPVANKSTKETPASVSDESKPLAGASHESKHPAVAFDESTPPAVASEENKPSVVASDERKPPDLDSDESNPSAVASEKNKPSVVACDERKPPDLDSDESNPSAV